MTSLKKSIIPATGDFANGEWANYFNLPQGASGLISAAAWTSGNEGFIQQTFLGASIRSFNLSAGFGDTASTLSVDLINDEYNKSDETGIGLGDDVYHSGLFDFFAPPPVGTPVYFKFGKNFATIEEAWRKTFDDIYEYNTITSKRVSREIVFDLITSGVARDYHFLNLENSDFQENVFSFVDQSEFYDPEYKKSNSRGENHFVFGGILQSVTQNKGSNGSPLFSTQIVDPREILSNTTLILNNYAGSIFDNKNYFNVYGFLEYDISDNLKFNFELNAFRGFNIGPIESEATWISTSPLKTNNLIEKVVDKSTGRVFYFGNDMYRFPSADFIPNVLPPFFPITGQGLSRRCQQGIPWYRVRQAMDALFNYNGFLPQEYIDKGFGGPINFRGFNYVVDFTGIPIEKIPQMYFLDFDQVDLLSLVQELCEVISHDLFVSLLPVINHPASKFLYNYNKQKIDEGKEEQIIAGIIRVDAINRSEAPAIGAIKSYLEELESRGIHVENQDLGYELSNITTDKIVAGAQEVEMYYFSSNKDRDNLQLRLFKNGLENNYEFLQEAQWLLETSLQQQILPFYGFLGNDMVTIPRGFGAYQQIMLDSSNLEAYGVGNYYIATEMELRAASISYENWTTFLRQYNETYIDEIGENRAFWRNLAATTPENTDVGEIFNTEKLFNREFGVSVPRCVFISDKNYLGSDGYPASPCAPPYGYPLYYKRAEKIGASELGVANFQLAYTEVLTNYENLKRIGKQQNDIVNDGIQSIDAYLRLRHQYISSDGTISEDERKDLNRQLENARRIGENLQKAAGAAGMAASIKNFIENNSIFFKQMRRLSYRHVKNARKVYDFVKSVADKHLGKTFLIKIPKGCNVNYAPQIETVGPLNVNNIKYGPYGFKPQIVSSNIDSEVALRVELFPYQTKIIDSDPFNHYLKLGINSYYKYGALKNNFNPISDQWEFNYSPDPQGGFFNFAIFDRNLSISQSSDIPQTKLPFAQVNLLAPMDLTNFLSNGRLSCYVRYDHSQDLDLSSIDSNSIYQQILTPKGFVPDIMEELNNVNPDKTESFNDIKNRVENNAFVKPPSVAFVKCDIDEKFYMIPKISFQLTPVYGRKYSWVKHIEPLNIIEKYIDEYTYGLYYEQIQPNAKIVNGKRRILVPTVSYAKPIFSPDPGSELSINLLDFNRSYSSDLDAHIIDTSKENCDPDHVYAIITIPGRIMPTVDKRYMDGPRLAMNGVSIKHTMTQDVVRMPFGYGFDKPAPIVNIKKPLDCSKFTLKQLTDAQQAQLDSFTQVGMANPEITIGFSQPSPVYPDLVVLPLMSNERCYGPWVSSSIFNGVDERVRYSDIGGKVEFVKDENLAPWNYAGYQLMNEAGALKAQFSNSLLLFSERGGFVIPEAPTGIALAKSLKAGGPLVTSISVDIAESIKTTVKMDLYTSRFGKLQKHKDEAVSKIVRERQKIIDQNNAMIKKGIGKNASSSNISSILKSGYSTLKNIADSTTQYYTSLEKKQTVFDNIVCTTYKENITDKDLITPDENKDISYDKYYSTVSIQDSRYLSESMMLQEDENLINETYNRSAGDNISNIFTPYTNSPYNQSMPSTPYNHIQALNKRIFRG